MVFNRPTEKNTLLVYLANYPRVVVRIYHTNKLRTTTEYLFKSFKNDSLVFLKKEGDLTGPLALSKMEFRPTCLVRTVGNLAAHYHYTGPLPWLNEAERAAAEWERIFFDVEHKS